MTRIALLGDRDPDKVFVATLFQPQMSAMEDGTLHPLVRAFAAEAARVRA